MATSKVSINNRVIMDITDTTRTAETIRQGYTAYRADGVKVTGTYTGSGGVDIPVFTITMVDEDTATVTCNKTFAQCRALAINDDITTAIAMFEGGALTSPALYYADRTTEIVYILYDDSLHPSATIIYYSNGTIEIETPPENPMFYQDKTVTPTTSQQVVEADSGYDALASVTVNAIQNAVANPTLFTMSVDTSQNDNFILQGKYDVDHTPPEPFYSTDSQARLLVSKSLMGNATTGQVLSGATFTSANGVGISGTIATKTASDLTASGATVTVPAGYYASQASKSVSSGTATAPTSISGTTATVSTGTNTLTLTKTVSVTPRITTAGYISSGTAGNASVSLSASVTTKARATITPGTTNQTIASGTYLTGTQTIAGDADLVASNIKNGVQIFGVTGNLAFVTYYTGTATPSSSLGQNGDIYLKVGS